MSDLASKRHQSIPVLYTRGTHYEVGFDMGRTFSGMIKEFLQVNTGLNQSLLPAFHDPLGLKLYNESLAAVTASFPQYIRELEGIAKGADVEFSKLFLLHLGDLLPHYVKMASFQGESACAISTANGCLNIVVNNYYNRYIAHTQDASKDMLNYSYLVSAHIINEEPQGKHKVTEEKFLSLCYAGHLPGFTMSSNHHGLVFAVNKLTPSTVAIGKTPPHFLARALLSAENMECVATILNDEGLGAADGFSLSIASINDRLKKCFIIEVAPAIIGATNSSMHISEIPPGSYGCHANKYEKLVDVNEDSNIFFEATDERLNKMASYSPPKTKEQILDIMDDEKIFLDDNNKNIQTVVLGIFDLSERTLSVYTNRPRDGDPLVIIPLSLKCNCRIFDC